MRRQAVRLDTDTRQRLRAYRNTAYHCSGFGTARIGQPAPVRLQDVPLWLIITAHNPASRRLRADENQAREQALERWLDTKGYSWHPCIARADSGDWPDETGCLVLNPDDGLCHAAGSQWGQNAVVLGCGYGCNISGGQTLPSLLIVRPEWIKTTTGRPVHADPVWLSFLDTTQGKP